jgi:signal transduction histidine kinase
MKLYQQLIIFVLAATAIPLFVGFAVMKHNEDQLAKRLMSSRQESAKRLAEVVQREMSEVFERLMVASGYFSPSELSTEELSALLGILYKQSNDIIQVALLNQQGVEVVPGLYLEDPRSYPEFASRQSVSPKDHELFIGGLPFKKAIKAKAGSVVIGAPQQFYETGLMSISIVMPIPTKEDGENWFAAVQVSLEPIILRILETGDTRNWETILVDNKGRVIAHPDREAIRSRLDLSDSKAMSYLKNSKGQGAFYHQDSLIACAKVAQLDWGVIISQGQSEAWAEIRRSRRLTVLWTSISIFALLIMGGLFTGRITKNLRRFVAGAEEFSRGNLDAKVELKSADELGTLAKTFNKMGADLKASRQEIEEWNRELEIKVEERTRELELTHRRLLETSKLAAIGQLGAGVAHEINNPLVGILGNVQILIKKFEGPDRQKESLKKIEAAAKRCGEVATNLLRFSEQEAEPRKVPIDIGKVLDDAFSMTEQRMIAKNISAKWEVADELPQVSGDHRQLMQVFLNLFDNAKVAMEDGGLLTISCKPTDNHCIVVEVKDTGKGIEEKHLDRIFEPFYTTKDVWTNTGMGLSVVYRIIADHNGSIDVESQVGKGSTFRVTLPCVGADA